MKDTNRLENSRPLPKDYNFSQDDLTTPSQIFLEAVCIKKKRKNSALWHGINSCINYKKKQKHHVLRGPIQKRWHDKKAKPS
jgi:hypothetical protein